MSRKSKRNILFWMKVLAICVAAVFMVKGVGDFYSSVKADQETQIDATENATVKQNTAATITENEEVAIKELEAGATQEITVTEMTEVEKASDPEQEEEKLIWSMDWDADESYLLAKIAMAEAEGEGVEGKALVMLVVLNRVWSDGFPDTIEEVIMQSRNGVHQFSVTADGGRWWKVEPDEECYEALELIMSGWNESRNALYFESPSKSTWHQEHLDFLFKYGNHSFYKDKGDK